MKTHSAAQGEIAYWLRGWSITADGWASRHDTMRTHDGRISMPLADVLLP